MSPADGPVGGQQAGRQAPGRREERMEQSVVHDYSEIVSTCLQQSCSVASAAHVQPLEAKMEAFRERRAYINS